MEIRQIWELQALIREAEFLNSDTKEVFLKKLPYLSKEKFYKLYAIFSKDAQKRKEIWEKRLVVFEKYKATLNGIFYKAKQTVLHLKEKAINKIDRRELQHLDDELKHT